MRSYLLIGALTFAAAVSAPQVRADSHDAVRFAGAFDSANSFSGPWISGVTDHPEGGHRHGARSTLNRVEGGRVISHSDSWAGSEGFGPGGVDSTNSGSGRIPTSTSSAGIDYDPRDTTGGRATVVGDVPTPEPSTLFLLFSALLAFAGAVTLRKLQA
jgi:hypothetical protein